MFLLVLRLLLVYFGTCAVALFLVNRYVSPVHKGASVFLALAPFLITGKAMLTAGVYAPIDIAYQAHPLASLREEMGIAGTRTPILGDVVSQEIPWRKAVREAIKNGRLPLWNRFILAGEPLLAMQQPAVFHPATWIGMLLPLAQAWTFEMTFTLFLALLSAWLFCRDLGLSPLAAGVGAAGWAFSDYLLFFLGYPLSPAVAPFPLLLLGLSRIAKERSARSVGITAAALLLSLTAGHSETLLHIVAAAGVYFLFQLFSEARRVWKRAVLLALTAGGVTVALGAIILLPHIEALPHTFEYFFRHNWYAKADRSDSLSQSLMRIPQIAIPYAFGNSGHGEFTKGEGPSVGYAGAMLLPLAALGMFSRRKEKWVILALGVVGFALWAKVPGITDAVCALPLFDIALNERLIFLTAFAAAMLAALGTEKIRSENAKRPLALAVVAALALLIVGYLLLEKRLLALPMPVSYLHLQFLLQIVPLGLLGVWLLARGERARNATAGVVFGLVLAQRAAEGSLLYPVYPNRAFYPPLHLLDGIPRNTPFRTTAVGFNFIPNISALYELEDVRGYEAMTFRPLVDTFPLWCVPQAVWFNRIDDPTKPFLNFLNVRYFLMPEGMDPPPGWRTIAHDLGIRVVENPHVLPRAFAPAMFQVAADAPGQLQLMQGIEDFGRLGVVERLPGRESGVWIPNGEASVKVLSYGARELSVGITARQPTLVATSVTAWPGWHLRIDGARSDLLSYNRAFLSFLVPPGEHRAELAYMPSGFVIGAIVSAVGFSSLIGAALFRRRRTAASPRPADSPAR
ncbi:MAG: YfhO family protein [Acidobacteriota bacterium]